MIRPAAILIILCVAAHPAGGTIVDLDAVFVGNGREAGFLDDFNDNVLGGEWFILGGAPGPEFGTVLRMHPLDLIFALIEGSPNTSTLAVASVNLPKPSPDLAVSFLLVGDTHRKDVLVLTLAEGHAFLYDEVGLLGLIPVDPGPRALLTLAIDRPAQIIKASVNGKALAAVDNTLGTPIGVAIGVVPEPPLVAWLTVGGLMALNRRLSRRTSRGLQSARTNGTGQGQAYLCVGPAFQPVS